MVFPLIPPFKDKKAQLVKGQHEPLISESLFYEVQDVLNGRKRKIKPKIVSMNNLPLRGFLKCPKCSRMLTGSASKGKYGKYYYYYHCSSSCGVRFTAENTNAEFVNELKKYIPNPGIIEVVVLDFRNQTKEQNSERRQIMAQIEKIDERMRNARELRVDGKLDEDDF